MSERGELIRKLGSCREFSLSVLADSSREGLEYVKGKTFASPQAFRAIKRLEIIVDIVGEEIPA